MSIDWGVTPAKRASKNDSSLSPTSRSKPEIARDGPGRPRCPESHAAVLAAARKQLEQDGYAKISIEGLARESGVGKPTIYRWWATKGAIFREIYVVDAVKYLGNIDTGSLTGDLRKILQGICHLFATRLHGQAFAGMFAEAQLDDRTMKDFQQGIRSIRERGLRGAIVRGIQRGELPRNYDPDFGNDLLFGPILYRLMLKSGPLDRKFANAIVDHFVHGKSLSLES